MIAVLEMQAVIAAGMPWRRGDDPFVFSTIVGLL